MAYEMETAYALFYTTADEKHKIIDAIKTHNQNDTLSKLQCIVSKEITSRPSWFIRPRYGHKTHAILCQNEYGFTSTCAYFNQYDLPFQPYMHCRMACCLSNESEEVIYINDE